MQSSGQPRADSRAGPGEHGQGLQREVDDDPVAGRVEVMLEDGDGRGLFPVVEPYLCEDLRQVPLHRRLLDARHLA
jgi:hypothetical protein